MKHQSMDTALLEEAGALLELLRSRKLKLTSAESCTGGLIGAYLTEIAGSSDVFERGFITYSNDAKSELLGVPADLIAEHGAVSYEVAGAMAQGALDHSTADVSVAVTGIAGPGGGSAEKPVGLVYIASARKGDAVNTERFTFGDAGRSTVRLMSVSEAFRLIREVL